MNKSRKIFAILVLSCLPALFCACHKSCVCQMRDGSERTYTEDELDKFDVSCTRMADYPVADHKVRCTWE